MSVFSWVTTVSLYKTHELVKVPFVVWAQIGVQKTTQAY